MTIEWRYTAHDSLGVLSLSGYLGAQAVDRFGGAIGWAADRGTGPLILDLTELKGWSAEGQSAIAEAAVRLAAHHRPLELAAIPADGSLVPDAAQHPIPVHPDLNAALTAHHARANEADRADTHETPAS
ncbi:STAS domain-containing protein [Streptomyces olivoreticuli]